MMANYYAVQNPMFQRQMMNILSITNGFPATVVTTFDGTNPGNNQYNSGLIVRLRIPKGWGMVQADQLEGPITVIDSATFSIPIDTTNMDPFVVPAYDPGHFGTPPQVAPVGEVNDILTEATQNILLP